MLKRIYKIKSAIAVAVVAVCGMTSCNDYLEVVPDDGNTTLEMAFNLRSTAITYLGTCYSFMPAAASPSSDPAFMGSDEFCDLWGRTTSTTRVSMAMTYLARGYQNSSSVYANNWSTLYTGIRDCDILMDNIDNVPDMDQAEKDQWRAEARFLKAYYHFCLMQKWGPIPIVKHSLSMDVSVDEARVYRDPIDSCFNFVLSELDKAIPYLAESVDPATEYGRITKAIAMSFKARVACYAASPLFNGNEDQAKLVDNRGVKLFATKTEEEKLARWKVAMDACKEAIDECELRNIKLYGGEDILYRMNDTLKTELILRGALTQNANEEVIWPYTQGDNLNYFTVMTIVNVQYSKNTSMTGSIYGWRFVGVPLKIAEQFYTKNGVPITMDKTRVGMSELDLRKGDDAHKFFLEQGYTSCNLNFDREPRFYSSLAFDGSKWLGALAESDYNDLTADKIYNVECRLGKYAGKTSNQTGPTTGYFPKKLYNYQNRLTAQNTNSYYSYRFPLMRLADLYLLYAEAINEYEGPNGAHSAEMFKYIDAVRERANIPGVKEAWDNYSTSPGYYNTQTGMRAIIHRERMIELAFECQRFWDLRRWKEAPEVYAENIYGFNVSSSSPEDYYKRTLVFEQPFTQKDYLWPISRTNLEHNPNLVQNVGW